MHRKHSQDFKFCLDGVSKQQHPHVVLKDREPLLLVVRVHDAYHPGGVEAGLREAAGEGPPGEALPVELLPLPGDQPPHVLLRVTSRILHQVQLPVRPSSPSCASSLALPMSSQSLRILAALEMAGGMWSASSAASLLPAA